MESSNKALPQGENVDNEFISEGSYVSGSEGVAESPEPGEIQDKPHYHHPHQDKYTGLQHAREVKKMTSEMSHLVRDVSMSAPRELGFSHNAQGAGDHGGPSSTYGNKPGDVDFLEGLLQDTIGQPKANSVEDATLQSLQPGRVTLPQMHMTANQTHMHQQNLGDISQGYELSHEPGQLHEMTTTNVSGPVAMHQQLATQQSLSQEQSLSQDQTLPHNQSLPQEQTLPHNQTQPQKQTLTQEQTLSQDQTPALSTQGNNAQNIGKENKEFVLFSWKDAKEFVTMSWHVTNCKVCRETFETWKVHAIRDHGLKPEVHKLNTAGKIETKTTGVVQQKGILTQNRSGNQPKTLIANNNKTSEGPRKDTAATVVLKHLATKLKPKVASSGSAASVNSKTHQYHCGLCNLHYKTEPELKLHLNVHAGQRIAFKCQKCDRIFMHQGMLQRHMAIHKEQNTICKICGRKFPDVQKARRHRYTHGKKMTFKCDKCKKTYTSMQSLRIHARTHSGEGMLQCKFCGKKFPSKFSLNSHERIHTGEKPYKCKFCNEHFITHSAMSYHKQIHTGFKYMCQHCGKGYRDKSNLREHERIHTGEKPFKCDLCDEAFTTGALMKYHRQVHTGERYECEICRKRYRSRGILNTHMRSHSNARPFICRFCGKGFREKATLKTHEKGVHLGVKFTCELCKREFTQRSALKTHEKGVHGMHGHKKAATGQKRRPPRRGVDNTTPLLPQDNIPAVKVTAIPLPTSEHSGPTEYHMETEYQVNSGLAPGSSSSMRQGQPINPDPYHEQVSAAHATTNPPYPMSNSDFHTMVDSLIQFSKDH